MGADQIVCSQGWEGSCKNQVMVAAIFGDDDVLCNQEATPRWIDLIMTFSIKYSEEHVTNKGGDWLSLGQLEQQVGACEANRKIDEGKYESREDSDGEQEYRLKKKKRQPQESVDGVERIGGQKKCSEGGS